MRLHDEMAEIRLLNGRNRHVGVLTLKFELWTLTFRISKKIRWTVDKRHVGTHSSCVRSDNRAFVFHSPCADARAVRPYMPLSMQLVHQSTCLLLNCACADARPVRPPNQSCMMWFQHEGGSFATWSSMSEKTVWKEKKYRPEMMNISWFSLYL